MKKILIVGDLATSSTRKCDLRFFFSRRDCAFVHLGKGKPLYALDDIIPWEEAMRSLDEYELIITGNTPFREWNPRKATARNLWSLLAQRLTQPGYWRLKQWQRKWPQLRQKLVALDMLDRSIIDNRRWPLLQHCLLYFKRELPQNPANAFLYTTDRNEDSGNICRQPFFVDTFPKLKPLSLGIDEKLLDKAPGEPLEKKYDVFFAGRVAQRPTRQNGLAQLHRLRDEGYRVHLPEERLKRDDFLRACAESYLVWSPEGFGYECHRTYEVAAYHSVPVIQHPTIQRLHPLRHGQEALYYGVEGDDLYHCLKKALADRPHLESMGRAARSHVEKYHAYAALGDYIITTARAALKSL